MLLNDSRDHFQPVRWQAQSDQLDPSSRLKAYGRSDLFYKAEQITIVPSDSILGYRSQIRDPNRQLDQVFSTGHACRQYFQKSILPEPPGGQSLRFQQADQTHPNPSVAGQFHPLNGGNG